LEEAEQLKQIELQKIQA